MNKEQVLALHPGDKVRYRWWDNWGPDPKQDGFAEVMDVSSTHVRLQWEDDTDWTYDPNDEKLYPVFWVRVELLQECGPLPITNDLDEVDVDGIVDDKGIVYFGKAKKQADGTWRCLADVCGALCVVEVKITMLEGVYANEPSI